MTNVQQTSRAGPSSALSGLLDAIPAGRKDQPAGTSFSAVLASKIKKGRGSRGEEPEPAASKPETDERTSETPPARKDERETPPPPVANAQTAPAQPVEPPPGGEVKTPDGEGDQPVGEAAANGAQAPQGKALPNGSPSAAAPDPANPADVKGAEGDPNAAGPDFAQAVQAAQDGEQSQTVPADKLAAKAKAAPAQPYSASDLPIGTASSAAREAAVARQPALNDLPAPAALRQAIQARETEKVQAQTSPKEQPESSAAHESPAASTQPGQAAPPGVKTVQVSVEGTRSATETSSIFEPARLAEAQAKGMVYQISQNVETMLKNRQTTLRVMLLPEELGRIDLRLTAGSGGMGVSLIARQDSTNQLLESQLPQLRQALDQAGIHLANLSVGQQQAHQAGSGQAGKRQNGHVAARSNSPAGVTAAEDRMVYSTLEPSEGFDYRV